MRPGAPLRPRLVEVWGVRLGPRTFRFGELQIDFRTGIARRLMSPSDDFKWFDAAQESGKASLGLSDCGSKVPL